MVTGVGLGLRWEFLDEVLDHIEREVALPIAFFEISPENYMRRGGQVPAALDRVGAAYPLLTHGLTMSVGGVDPFDGAYFGELGAFLRRYDPPFHSDHLCFGGYAGRLVHDLLPLPFSREAARHAGQRVREASARLERPMALENITYYFAPGASEMSEAQFVREVVEGGDCGLLLDVNNVYVNAKNHGGDPFAMLAAMPLERVVQLHVAGHAQAPEDDLLVDSHGADVIDPVLELLTWTVSQTGPLPVLLERDNAIPPFEQLLAEVARVDAAYRAGLERRGAVGHA